MLPSQECLLTLLLCLLCFAKNLILKTAFENWNALSKKLRVTEFLIL